MVRLLLPTERDDRIVQIGPKLQIQLGVQVVTKEQFHDQLSGAKLRSEPTETCFVCIGRRAERIDRCGEPSGRRTTPVPSR